VCRSISIWHSIDVCLCMGWSPVCMHIFSKAPQFCKFYGFLYWLRGYT
jgi:hypothetical protein